LIVVACYQRVIVAHSANIGVSFFIFIAMFYTFFFNAARQGIACAIFALAIGPLLKEISENMLVMFFLHVFSIIQRSLCCQFIFSLIELVRLRIL